MSNDTIGDGFGMCAAPTPHSDKDQRTFHAIAWGDRIRDEQLDELLERTKDSHTVVLRIDQFRDLVQQAKEPKSASGAISLSEVHRKILELDRDQLLDWINQEWELRRTDRTASKEGEHG